MIVVIINGGTGTERRQRSQVDCVWIVSMDHFGSPFFFVFTKLRVYQKVVVPLTAAGQEPCLYIILLYPDYGHINNYAADNKNTTEQWRLGSAGLLWNALYTFIINIAFVSFLIISRRWVVSSSSTGLLWLRRLLPFPRAMHFILKVIIQITPTLVYLSSATCVYWEDLSLFKHHRADDDELLLHSLCTAHFSSEILPVDDDDDDNYTQHTVAVLMMG